MLAHQPLGHATGGPSVVLAHGFTQNARCWGDFGTRCSDPLDVIAVDAPGHGQSGHDAADLHQAGKLITDAGGRAHYVGYSMGGRMLLHAAVGASKAAFRSLILIGATPGIEENAVRRERKREDAQLASRIESIGTQAFITEWLARPMFAHLSDEQTCRAKRLENSAEGLAASLRNCGTGTQEPLWEQLGSIAVPVLVIAGTSDATYTAIGKKMVDRIGSNARFVGIEGGHAAHLENPAAVAAVVESWCTQLG